MEIKVISDKENRIKEICELIILKGKERGINTKDSFENSFNSLCLDVCKELNLNYFEGVFKEVYLI